MKTQAQYLADGWSIIEHDDDAFDIIELLDEQLTKFGLKIEMSDDDCDGFQPIRVVTI